jgi:hypothetical protein
VAKRTTQLALSLAIGHFTGAFAFFGAYALWGNLHPHDLHALIITAPIAPLLQIWSLIGAGLSSRDIAFVGLYVVVATAVSVGLLYRLSRRWKQVM